MEGQQAFSAVDSRRVVCKLTIAAFLICYPTLDALLPCSWLGHSRLLFFLRLLELTALLWVLELMALNVVHQLENQLSVKPFLLVGNLQLRAEHRNEFARTDIPVVKVPLELVANEHTSELHIQHHRNVPHVLRNSTHSETLFPCLYRCQCAVHSLFQNRIESIYVPIPYNHLNYSEKYIFSI